MREWRTLRQSVPSEHKAAETRLAQGGPLRLLIRLFGAGGALPASLQKRRGTVRTQGAGGQRTAVPG